MLEELFAVFGGYKNIANLLTYKLDCHTHSAIAMPCYQLASKHLRKKIFS